MFLMKVAQYGPVEKDSDYYKDLAAQRINPSIEKGSEKSIKEATQGMRLIACSPLKRAQETAEIAAPHVRVDDDLREIPFLLDDIPGVTSALARERFVRDFIADRLPERRKSIQDRIERVLSRYGPRDLCVSHTFFIRLLQLHVEKDIFTRPETLGEYIQPEKRVMEFGEIIKITKQ